MKSMSPMPASAPSNFQQMSDSCTLSLAYTSLLQLIVKSLCTANGDGMAIRPSALSSYTSFCSVFEILLTHQLRRVQRE